MPDYGSNTEADAGRYEQAVHGEERRPYRTRYSSDDVPTLTELDAEERAERDR